MLTKALAGPGDEDDLISHVFLRRREDEVEDGPKYALVKLPDEKEEFDEE